MRQTNKTVYVGMSGGVDSSVAAALLKKQGFDVVGVFMKPWSPFATNSKSQILNSNDSDWCLWKQDREDALRAASIVGIPLLTWDFSKEYKKSVTDYMIREYKSGRTPNPDVMCNKEIKFGLFLDKALKDGADYIATGHYVIKKGNQLWEAKDKNKDQSYFLWTLTQKQLKHCLFPIGNFTKPEVRKLARKFKLPNADKKDSQGVCFIGPLNMKEFLTEYIKPKPGKILHTDGRVLGTHDGVYYYTIGQRHGLNITIGGGPYFVVSKNIKKNLIVVGDDAAASSPTTAVSDFNWISKPSFGPLGVRVRYRAPISQAKLNKKGELKFVKPERAVTPGQSAVFYRGEQMLGG